MHVVRISTCIYLPIVYMYFKWSWVELFLIVCIFFMKICFVVENSTDPDEIRAA